MKEQQNVLSQVGETKELGPVLLSTIVHWKDLDQYVTLEYEQKNPNRCQMTLLEDEDCKTSSLKNSKTKSVPKKKGQKCSSSI